MVIRKGQIIFRQGENGEHAFLIEKGQVEIFHTKKDDQEVHLAVLGEGELFGEMALFESNIRSASTRALSDCKLLVIKREQLFERVNSSDKIVQLIIRVLMKRLKQKNLEISGVSVAIPESPEGTSSDVQALQKLKFENEINEAFLNKEFRIYHQPIVELQTRKIVGSEALIRWESPSKGLISPGKFVDVLENSAMIVPVGYWIIEQCFQQFQIAKVRRPNFNFSVSINISGRQFLHYNFFDKIQSLVAHYKVDPAHFKLEITERILMEGGGVIDILHRCQKLGFKISLDDFGTGFSSLQYLAQMPIDFLKIDRSFVMNIAKDEKTKSVVSAIVYLAKKLNIQVISEGIESEVEERIMLEMGSKFGQGYFYSKPVDFDSFVELI